MTREAFESLEKKCIKLRVVLFAKWFLLLLAVVAVGIFLFTSFFGKQEIVKQVQKKALQTAIPTKVEETNETKIEANVSVQYNTVLLKSTVVIPKTVEKKESVHGNSDINKVINEFKEIKKNPITMKQTAIQGEAALLQSNSENESFSSVLKLAQYYLEDGQYEKAIEYAIKANHYNRSSFTPWSIYAKAKLKQNKKSDAIKALQSFLSYYVSDEAENLLLDIEEKK